MLPANDGEWIRGESLPVTLNAKLNYKTDFLAKARNMKAPEIAEFVFQFTGTVGGVTATALGPDAPKLVSRYRIKDKDLRCDASGAMLNAHNEFEFGAPNNQARFAATVASGATNTSYEYRMSIPYEFPDATREQDYRIPVPYILEGGVIQATIASAVPTGWAAVQSDWLLTVWCRVVEQRERELKSTLCYEQFSHTRMEDFFPINGSIRSLVACTDLSTTSYTSIATYTAVNSKALDLETDFDPRLWRERYLRQKPSGATLTSDLAGGGFAWPIVIGDRHQRIGAMPNIDQLDLRLQAAPVANSALLVAKIVDRSPSLAAAWMGYASTGELAAAIEQWGYIVDEKNTKYTDFDPVLAARLPVRIRRGA